VIDLGCPSMDAKQRFSIASNYLARLIVKARAVQAKTGEVDPNSGSNPIDDKMQDVLQDDPGDLSREELREEIQGLDQRQQAELIALLWVGRGDAEPEEWEQTVKLALDQGEAPTRCLLRHPLLSEHWEEGAARLKLEVPIGSIAGNI
jgi:hypothetical protein